MLSGKVVLPTYRSSKHFAGNPKLDLAWYLTSRSEPSNRDSRKSSSQSSKVMWDELRVHITPDSSTT